MNLNLSTFKSVSNIVKHIPLIGYLVLGDEGCISTKVRIRGKLANPIVKSQIIKDTLKAPVNIIKRTLGIPLKIFQ